MPHYPAAPLLVPAGAPAAPADFTVVRSSLTQGFPHFVDLTTGLRLKVTLPTGVLQPWLDADPSALVATSDDELLPRTATSAGDVADLPGCALRFAVIRGGRFLATTPAALGPQRVLPDAGDPAQGVAVAIIPLGWRIAAGTLRGPGDFGSVIEFGWKIANLGADDFQLPVLNPYLRRRLGAGLTLHSDVGLTTSTLDPRFATRRLALNVTA